MSVKAKYQGVLNLGEQLGIKDGNVTEEGGVLKIKGVANTPYEKDLLSPDTRKALEARGHILKTRNNMGALMGITFDSEKGIFVGASDSSQPDSGAVGY